ncbi:DUF6580 family putative transport protein [Membranihabitans marinus]|uniref:DUF6580 family putative transport protein n=1 Tax=Membranihabitans marinus TaxID=1227546 RepID=UPI001F3CFE36|nr:DUF6580 family putative transport protein [Membranihabitans marinus]
MMKLDSKTPYIVLGTIVALAIARLLPHPSNFTPLGGIAILGATYYKRSVLKYLIPVLAFYLSDILVSNILFKSFYPDQGFVFFSSHMAWSYLSIALIVLAVNPIMKNKNIKNLLGSAVLGSILFFLISNFGAWMGGNMYPKSLSGLMACYAAGIPFFGNTLASFVIFSALGYGIVEYSTKAFKDLRLAYVNNKN